jgi:hypothetical protein
MLSSGDNGAANLVSLSNSTFSHLPLNRARVSSEGSEHPKVTMKTVKNKIKNGFFPMSMDKYLGKNNTCVLLQNDP